MRQPHSYGDLTAPSPAPLNRDRMSMMPREEVARVAHAALNGIQRERPEAMVMGVALLFASIMQRCNLSADEMHRMGLRVLRYEAGMRRDNDSLQSLRDFAGIRIMGERDVPII